MEISKGNTSLQQKLELLKALRQGKLQQSEKILANLSVTARTNPALYSKFHTFLSEHRTHIQQIEKEEKVDEPKVVFVEGSDDEWITDDSVSLSDKEEENQKQAPQEDEVNERRLMKNVSNTKSTILLHNMKQAKRPFLIQTKLKETKGVTSSTMKHRGSSVTKLEVENKSLLTTLSKSNLLSKNLVKQSSKPYFPPISGAKSTLKLLHK